MLVLVESENEAARMCADINTFAFGEIAAVFPAKDPVVEGADTRSNEYEHRRIAVLANLPPVILATPESAAQSTFMPAELAGGVITLTKGDEIRIDTLTADLVGNGYTRTDMVESPSQFSVRGSVVDIFPVNFSLPVRLDLWGDEIEDLALFEVETQRRGEKIENAQIAPAVETAGDGNLFDFVRSIILCELPSLEQSEFFGFVPQEKIYARFDTFSRSGMSVNIDAKQLPAWNGDYRQLREDLREFLKCGYAVVVFGGAQKAARSLADDLREDGLPADYATKPPKKVYLRHVFVLPGALSAGFDYPDSRCACITVAPTGRRGEDTSADLCSTPRAPKPKRKNKSEAVRVLTDINVGDYVVHDNYGIGIFEGVTKLTADGASKDYIKLKYAGKDVLYVPVTQLDFIARYIGNTESANLKLSRLNTDTWFNTRSKVKKAVDELAEELIKLYEERLKARGHAFAGDGREQFEFENAFGYIETDDQLTCIAELKSDMESERPMDRLLCGDVGFGKTEVALRGAFKCIMDGKQVALLCPTTVLAWQHYQTALRRFGEIGRQLDLPISIELLSRFRSLKERRAVIAKLESGGVDFVIGTHSVIAESVKFKNLGLVIIDEEQRFGVAQKERLKEAFLGVDVLTLSATPIPRTLNMAMSGIRDMSVIETPPHDRIPVTTYVIEQDYGVIAQAVSKELRRAGQVYYVHNRVESIVSCAAKLKEMIPEARIGIAHGKMDERELLDVWRRLLEHDIDILVCTTLIETGIDVPNVNTLIIENADYMGLAQLHQLRGRVGRTNRRAYAYFCFARGKVVSEIAQKRLNAVRDFTQFGAGFRIALRDLEIRGAGSVLGESQSGHLSSVGYEMYVRMLEDAVREQNGQPTVDLSAVCTVDVKVDAFVPESYVSNQSQRISVYKKIAEIRDEDAAADITAELTDRYGVIPKSVTGLIQAARIRNIAGALGIAEVVHVPDSAKPRLVFYWETPDMAGLARLSERFAHRVELNMVGRVNVTVNLAKVMWRDKGRWKESEALDDVLDAAMSFVCELSGRS
jgi:transcription-repair coupling factor (superfamily II helicase)